MSSIEQSCSPAAGCYFTEKRRCQRPARSIQMCSLHSTSRKFNHNVQRSRALEGMSSLQGDVSQLRYCEGDGAVVIVVFAYTECLVPIKPMLALFPFEYSGIESCKM